MAVTRRTFNRALAVSTASTIFSHRKSLGSTLALQSSTVTRREINDPLAANDLQSLRDAVGAMRRLGSNDGRSWRGQAEIHGVRGRYHKCQHSNWFFMPWHRAYLFYFENLIRFFSRNPDFALPYWDWSTGRGVPASFYGGTSNPLDDSTRNRRASGNFSSYDLRVFVGAVKIRERLNDSQFRTFGGSQRAAGMLENEAHGRVHNWVSGNMASVVSPLDPIFWLHHCNIDRLFSAWLNRSGHRPPGSGWQNQSFNDFYDEFGRSIGRGLTCGQMLDTERALGYQYDSLVPGGGSSLFNLVDRMDTERWQRVAIIGSEETVLDRTLVYTMAVSYTHLTLPTKA